VAAFALMAMPGSTATAIDGIYNSMLALVYPQACAVCAASVESRHDAPGCAACWESTKFFTDSDTLCWKCGAFTEANASEHQHMSIRCGRCEADNFTAARACGPYEGVLRASVLALKREPHVGRRLLETMARTQQRTPVADAELIIPVPLHAKRERDRGHNQAAVLASALSRASGLGLDEHVLIRHLHTERHRAGMDARARRESVAGAFEVRAPKQITGRRVLLVDDVFTTGATVSECASVLKGAGATEVFVLTIALA
jgi:ComF family protein